MNLLFLNYVMYMGTELQEIWLKIREGPDNEASLYLVKVFVLRGL